MAEAFVFSSCEVTGRRQRNAQPIHSSARRVGAIPKIVGESAPAGSFLSFF
jgi:hypothetical protein